MLPLRHSGTTVVVQLGAKVLRVKDTTLKKEKKKIVKRKVVLKKTYSAKSFHTRVKLIFELVERMLGLG